MEAARSTGRGRLQRRFMRSRTRLETETLVLEFPPSPGVWNCPSHCCTSFHIRKRAEASLAHHMVRSFRFIRLRGGLQDAKASQLLLLFLVYTRTMRLS